MCDVWGEDESGMAVHRGEVDAGLMTRNAEDLLSPNPSSSLATLLALEMLDCSFLGYL